MGTNRISNIINKIVPQEHTPNSVACMLMRQGGRLFKLENVPVTASSETKSFNVFKVTGTVLIVDQYATITEATALTNCTAVHANAYDGTNTVDLTDAAPGATLSGAPVGTFFTKDGDNSQAFTVNLADEVRVSEPGNKAAAPFYVTANASADTYIRVTLTTNTTLNFKMTVWFWWYPVDGGNLELA